MQNPNKSSIAIIGAGASGIINAINLKELGYDNVVVFEKGEVIANSTKTHFIEGRPYDLSTKYIPAISLTHHGVLPELEVLINKTGFRLKAAADAIFFDFERGKKVITPEPLRRFGLYKIISDFVRGYDLLSLIEKLYDIENVLFQHWQKIFTKNLE